MSKRERTLAALLALMLVLMFLSREPELVGVEIALALAWVAFLLFFAMIGVLVFMPDDTMERLTAKSAKQAAANARERAQARVPQPPHRQQDGYGDGLD